MSLRNEALAVTLNTKITQEIDLCWHSFPILNYLPEIQTRTVVKIQFRAQISWAHMSENSTFVPDGPSAFDYYFLVNKMKRVHTFIATLEEDKIMSSAL